MAKITGKTKSGFQFSIEEEARDDMELLESIIKLDKGDYTAITDVVVRLLGDKQKEKLYEHCRDKKTGRVRVTKICDEVEAIFTAVENQDESDTKNS